jgi:hypothetical protein
MVRPLNVAETEYIFKEGEEISESKPIKISKI